MCNDRESLPPAPHRHWLCACRIVAALIVLSAAGAGATGCGQAVRSGRSPVVLIINRLEGAPGAEPANLSTVLHSDVETLVEGTRDGEQSSVPTLFADVGQAELRLALKDV